MKTNKHYNPPAPTAKTSTHPAAGAAESPRPWLPPELLQFQNYIAWVLIAIPALLGLLYVHSYGVNIGWEDQLNNMPPLFEKWYAGSIPIADFWKQINEHRHFFPTAVMFFLAVVTSWNTMAELYLLQALFASILVIYILAMRRGSGSNYYAWFCVPIAAMVFSLRQNQNMLTGFQIAFVMAAAISLATFYSLSLMTDPRRLILKFAFALSFATLAGFSSAQGLLVWMVGAVQLLVLSQPWRRKLTYTGIWLAVGVIEWIVYFKGYQKPPWHPDYAFTLEYFSAIVGGALYPIALLAQTAGWLLVPLTAAAVVMAFFDWGKGRHSFWLAIILFGLMTECQTTLGRAGGIASGQWTINQALSSRYATFSLFVVIGAYGIFSCLDLPKLLRPISALWGAMVTLATVGVIISTYEGIEVGKAWWQERDYHAFVFLTYESQPDEALPTAPWEKGNEVRKKLDFLKEHKLNVFASPEARARWETKTEPLPVLANPARLELSQPQITKDTGLITLAGFALDDLSKEPVGAIYIEVDGKPYRAYYGYRSEQVASSLKNPDAMFAGFRRDFSARQLGAGTHTLRTRVLTADRKSYYRPSDLVRFDVPEMPAAPDKK